MNDFTASNGFRVGPHPSRGLGYAIFDESGENTLDNSFSHLNTFEMDALREFFRAEEDERLGRWRWPENPDYVVYPSTDSDMVRVLWERGVALLEWVKRGDTRSHEFCHAARAYFDAHPTPLPTQPGLYMGALLGDFPTIWSLNGDGRWYLINTGSLFPVEDGHIQKYLPFTPLHPEVTP